MRQKVTGQVLLRDAHARAAGRRIVYGVCILAVPDDFDFKDNHQYLIGGESEGHALVVSVIGGAKAEDRSDHKDVPPTELLERPIWKV